MVKHTLHKKTLLVVLLVALAAGTVFALPEFKLGAGAGIIGAGNWQSLTTERVVAQPENKNSLVGGGTENRSETKALSPLYDFGGFLFFDATYAELDVTLGGGKAFDGQGLYDAFKLGLALYGKYPFAIGDSGISIAPLVGVQFDMVLSAQDDYGNKVQKGDKSKGTGVLLYDGKDGSNPKYKEGSAFDFSTLSLKLGAEAKAPLAGNLYLSTQAMWGITFDSAYITAQKKLMDDFGAIMNVKDVKTFNHGVTFKVGVGCTF